MIENDYKILFDVDWAKDQYNSGLTFEQIGELVGCSESTIRYRLKKDNFKTRRLIKGKSTYFLDEFVFEVIDSEEKAYWLGFLFADGSVSDDNRITLSLSQKDLDHLEKFKEYIKYTGPIRLAKNTTTGVAILSFRSEIMAQHLSRLNVVPRKSAKLIPPPSLDLNLKRHFIRGYFDGDGCVHETSKNTNSKFKVACNAVSYESFIDYLIDGIPIKCSKSFQQTKNYVMCYLKGSWRVAAYIYKDSNIHMKRKFDKIPQEAFLYWDKDLKNSKAKILEIK